MRKYINLTILTMLSLTSFSQSRFDWQEYLDQNIISPDFLEFHYNDYYAAKNKPWYANGMYTYSLNTKTPYDFNNKSAKTCSKELFPAHPYALTKEYHYAVYKNFDHKILPGDSYSCLIKAHQKKPKCLRSGTLHLAVLSDTYVDKCGNYFRGFFTAAYNSDDENIGTLLSKGRTVRHILGSPFKNDYEADETYTVSSKDFFFLSPLFEKDLEKIKKYQKRARDSKRFKLYLQKNLIRPIKKLIPKAKVF